MTDVHAKPRNADGRLSRSRSGASIYWMEKWRTAKESKPLLGILQGVKALLASADLDDVLNIVNKYLAVAYVTGVKHLFGGCYNL